ncbi:VOC family protein [Parvibaculum sp.]|uniref:VOC family protein n=1 Tax=Parvibaculum sp. TaxID=2024848 RepID=UPI003BACA275
MSTMPRFHLAFAVDDLSGARDFYGRLLGCAEGRSGTHWVDFDFHGHQIVAHLAPRREGADAAPDSTVKDRTVNEVDGDDVPVPHFGLILGWDEWHELAARLKAEGVRFVVEPHIRFQGKPGEQATMFFRDPSGNAIEIKSFQDEAQIFAK